MLINTDATQPFEALAAEPRYQLLLYQLIARQVEVYKIELIDSAAVLHFYAPNNRTFRRVAIAAVKAVTSNAAGQPK